MYWDKWRIDVANQTEGHLQQTNSPLHRPTTEPQRPWVGLTDEDCKGMNAGNKVVAMWANRILKEKNT